MKIIKLNETYKIDQDLIYEMQKMIRFYLNQSTNPSGNGNLCQTLCSLYKLRTGHTIDPDDYIVHHLNGDHDDNAYSNIVLINKNGDFNHTKDIHEEAVKSALSKFFSDNYHLHHNDRLSKRVLGMLSFRDEMEILSNYIEFLKIGTRRKSNRSTNSDDIIFVVDFI